MLAEEGLLDKESLAATDWGQSEDDIDYSKIYENRFKVLKEAFSKTKECESAEYSAFISENQEVD